MRKLLSIVFAVILFATTQGFAQEAHKRIEAESFNETDNATTKESKGVTFVNQFARGSWIKFDELDFGKEGAERLKFRVSSGSKASPTLEIRLGSHKGKLLGKINVEVKRWGNYTEQILQIPKIKGRQTITIVSTKGGVLLDWFEID